jgi:hypothetical protein
VIEELTQEDRTILAALEALEAGTSGEAPAAPVEPSFEADSVEAEMLARLYTEVLGLLPAGLEPAAPRPEAKARLLAAISPQEAELPEPAAVPAAPQIDTQEITPRPAPAPSPPSTPRVPPGSSREVPLAYPSPRPTAAAVPRRRSSWPLALAAALILVLGGLSGWLALQRTQQEERIASLERALSTERNEASQALARVTEMNRSLAAARSNLGLVTSSSIKVAPLQPTNAAAAMRGMLYVASDNQHWYLALHDLPPPGPGRTYQLWWVAGEKDQKRMVSGGTFSARPNQMVELSSATMPEDTRDVVVTVEREGGMPAPSGPQVLKAGNIYQIL